MIGSRVKPAVSSDPSVRGAGRLNHVGSPASSPASLTSDPASTTDVARQAKWLNPLRSACEVVGDPSRETDCWDSSWIDDGDQFDVDAFEHDEPVGGAERVRCLGGDDESEVGERTGGRVQLGDGKDQMVELGHVAPGADRFRDDR